MGVFTPFLVEAWRDCWIPNFLIGNFSSLSAPPYHWHRVGCRISLEKSSILHHQTNILWSSIQCQSFLLLANLKNNSWSVLQVPSLKASWPAGNPPRSKPQPCRPPARWRWRRRRCAPRRRPPSPLPLGQDRLAQPAALPDWGAGPSSPWSRPASPPPQEVDLPHIQPWWHCTTSRKRCHPTIMSCDRALQHTQSVCVIHLLEKFKEDRNKRLSAKKGTYIAQERMCAFAIMPW